MKVLTELDCDKVMVAILQDMLFLLKFLCTPIVLTSLEDFKKETLSKCDREKEEILEKIRAHIFSVMDQKEPICSALPPQLLSKINDIYIKWVSKHIGFIGSPERTQQHAKYQEGFEKYVEEVEVELRKKVDSVVKDAADCSDLGLVTDCLVIK